MSSTETDVDAFVEFEANGYSKVAGEYDRHFGSLTPRTADALLDAAGVGRGSRVLDVGTGPGYVAARAAARGAYVLGVDLSPGCIDVARRLHPELEFRRAMRTGCRCRTRPRRRSRQLPHAPARRPRACRGRTGASAGR